ncbi:hypothetical protein U1701_02745 [Sphingomonas sp. PB2P19]|uniref:hypothetical protein n=1 Tax=Sphingomonas rhamnosi TaxID=3096156 RepID=UPI002FC7CFA0
MQLRYCFLPLIVLLPFATAQAATKSFIGGGGLVRLSHPANLNPTRTFSGRALMTGGWRLMWDGKPVGRGVGIARFWQVAKPKDGVGQVMEMVQIGFSRDAGVVARCGTDGAKGANTRRLPDRMLGGQRWTVYTNGDAGMSQAIAATDLRTVVDGTCYAVDRVTYSIKAGAAPGRTAPTRAVAAANMDAILATIHVGRRR